MNKTIEEAIKDGWNICDKAADMGSFDFYNTGFLNGVAHLRSLPLAQRLTAEEKERVRKEYWRAARDWIGIGDARGYCRTCIALESIFGADFFKEG